MGDAADYERDWPYHGSWLPKLRRSHYEGMRQIDEAYGAHVAKLSVAWDISRAPSISSFAKMVLVDGKIEYHPITAEEFFALQHPI